MTTTTEIESSHGALCEAVTAAQAAFDEARPAADAARQAVSDAEQAVESYKARALAGHSTTGATWGAKVDTLELARLALPGYESKESAAQERLRAATSDLVVAEVGGDGRLSRNAQERARELAADLLRQALAVLEDHFNQRNEALSEARKRLDSCGAPSATEEFGGSITIHESPESPVHRLDNHGLLVDGRKIRPENANRHAMTILAHEIKGLLPLAVREKLV